MTRTRTLAILFGAVFFVACSSSTPVEPEPGGARLELSVSPTSVALGQRVPVTLTLLNDGNRPLTFSFTTSCQVDLIIEKSSVEVWSLLSRAFCALGVTTFTLQPDQSVRYGLSWDQSRNDGGAPQPGTYVVRGILQNADRLQADPVTLTVRP